MSRKVCIGHITSTERWVSRSDRGTFQGRFSSSDNYEAANAAQWDAAGGLPVYIDAPPRKRKLGKKEADEWCKQHDVEIIERPKADPDMRFQAYPMKGGENAFAPTRMKAIIALRKLMRGKK